MPLRPGRSPRRRRRGTLYAIILACAAMVALMGLTGAVLNRAQMERLNVTADAETSRLLAQSALQMGLRIIRTDEDWRDRGEGTWMQDVASGDGTFSVSVSDPLDGDLDNDPTHPVRLTGAGECGDARFVIAFDLYARQVAYDCLASCLHVSQNINISKDCVISSAAPISSNQSINASQAEVYAPVICSGPINGGTYHAATAPDSAPRKEPDDDVFDTYSALGTAISIWSLPKEGGWREISEQLIGPSHNPYGSTNSRGVYVIDCANRKLRITESRIYGTLVLLNAQNVRIEDEVYWSPATRGWPILLVEGDLSLELAGDQLEEDDVERNLNPSGAPYQGQTDGDQSDSYPSRLDGLIYVSERLTVRDDGDNRIQGLIITQRVSFQNDASLNIDHDPIYYQSPPPGFQDTVRMEYQPRSGRQVVD